MSEEPELEKTYLLTKLPHFCLVEITQEEFIAGGYLAGKNYSDIEADLNKFQYKKISIPNP